MNYSTPPERAKEIRVDAKKIIAEIEAGRLEAINVAAPGSRRPRYRISETAWQEFLHQRQVKPLRRRRRLETQIKQYF
jgi:hypothetical protein